MTGEDGLARPNLFTLFFFSSENLQSDLMGISGSDLFETVHRNHYLYDTFNCIGHVQSNSIVHHVFLNRKTSGYIGIFSNLGT